MSKFASLLPLLATMLACTLFTAPAQAQRDRVFVASYGSDSNPCTFGSPCKTFQHAHDTVATDGEVTAIDSAGFGPLTITKGITITSPNGVEAGIAAAPGGNAIAINANDGDKIFLHGLTLNGAFSGRYGIAFSSGAALYVYDCVIEKFIQDGILFDPQHAGSLFISDTQSLQNIGNGINIMGSDNVVGNLTRVETNGNVGIGIRFANRNVSEGSFMTMNAIVSSDNAGGGLICPTINGENQDFTPGIVVLGSTISMNGGPGIDANSCGLSIGRSTIFFNNPDFTNSQVGSYDDNASGGTGSLPGVSTYR